MGPLVEVDLTMITDHTFLVIARYKIQPYELKEINGLYYVVTNNIKNKYQCNNAIDYETKFGNKLSLSSGSNRDNMKIVTVSLRGVNKNRANIIASLTCLYDSRLTDRIIRMKQTMLYDHNISSNNLHYSTATGPYCMKHDVKVQFCMLELSSNKTILHLFHGENDEVESGIGYDMITGRDLLVQIGLVDDFKSLILQW